MINNMEILIRFRRETTKTIYIKCQCNIYGFVPHCVDF